MSLKIIIGPLIMWTPLLSNPEKIQDFLNPLPDLSEVELMSIELMSCSTDMLIRFDLNIYPKNPPQEWEGRNTMQIELSILHPKNIEISGWHYPMKGILKAKKTADGVELLFESKNGRIKCESQEFFHVAKVSAYSKAN